MLKRRGFGAKNSRTTSSTYVELPVPLSQVEVNALIPLADVWAVVKNRFDLPLGKWEPVRVKMLSNGELAFVLESARLEVANG